MVAIATVGEVINERTKLQSFCKTYKVELVLLVNHARNTMYNYGCTACETTFPNTLFPLYERRTWRLLEDENKSYNRILIIDSEKRFNTLFNNITKVKESDHYYLITNNHMKTMDLLKLLAIETRPY